MTHRTRTSTIGALTVLLATGTLAPAAVAGSEAPKAPEIVSIGPDGEPVGPMERGYVSGNGRYVAFNARAGQGAQVYRYDRRTGATVLVSQDLDGSAAGGSVYGISHNGRHVGFRSGSDGVLPGDENDTQDLFVRDVRTGTSELVNVGFDGTFTDSYATYLPRTRRGHARAPARSRGR